MPLEIFSDSLSYHPLYLGSMGFAIPIEGVFQFRGKLDVQ
jgi:hypothetical protein